MLELGTFGSVRGVPGDGYPYRNPRPLADYPERLLGAHRTGVGVLNVGMSRSDGRVAAAQTIRL